MSHLEDQITILLLVAFVLHSKTSWKSEDWKFTLWGSKRGCWCLKLSLWCMRPLSACNWFWCWCVLERCCARKSDPPTYIKTFSQQAHRVDKWPPSCHLKHFIETKDWTKGSCSTEITQEQRAPAPYQQSDRILQSELRSLQKVKKTENHTHTQTEQPSKTNDG